MEECKGGFIDFPRRVIIIKRERHALVSSIILAFVTPRVSDRWHFGLRCFTLVAEASQRRCPLAQDGSSDAAAEADSAQRFERRGRILKGLALMPALEISRAPVLSAPKNRLC